MADKKETEKSASRIFFLLDRQSDIDPLSEEGKTIDTSIPRKSKSKRKSSVKKPSLRRRNAYHPLEMLRKKKNLRKITETRVIKNLPRRRKSQSDRRKSCLTTKTRTIPTRNQSPMGKNPKKRKSQKSNICPRRRGSCF